MKKNILLVVVLFATSVVTFVGCSKEEVIDSEDTGLSTLTISGRLEKDTAKVEVFADNGGDKYDRYKGRLGMYEVTRKTFSITVREPNPAILTLVRGQYPPTVAVSDVEAKCIWASVFADGRSISKLSASLATESYIYVDRDVTVSGIYSEFSESEDLPEGENSDDGNFNFILSTTITIDVQLKKGWNILVETMVPTTEGELMSEIKVGSIKDGKWTSDWGQ